jgi:hypothetical protein
MSPTDPSRPRCAGCGPGAASTRPHIASGTHTRRRLATCSEILLLLGAPPCVCADWAPTNDPRGPTAWHPGVGTIPRGHYAALSPASVSGESPSPRGCRMRIVPFIHPTATHTRLLNESGLVERSERTGRIERIRAPLAEGRVATRPVDGARRGGADGRLVGATQIHLGPTWAAHGDVPKQRNHARHDRIRQPLPFLPLLHELVGGDEGTFQPLLDPCEGQQRLERRPGMARALACASG